METHLHTEIQNLKQKLIEMSQLVRNAVENSTNALFKRDKDLALEVLEREQEINQLEMDIDDIGRSLCALHQPMAYDLRMLIMILKMSTDLERMGDHAVNIAERTLYLIEEPPLETNLHLKEMTEATQKMLDAAFSAFVKEDVALAQSVLKQDDVIDRFNDELYVRVGELIEKDPLITRTGMNLVMIGHNLERIADLTCNIAEDVIYLKQGKEVRHHKQS